MSKEIIDIIQTGIDKLEALHTPETANEFYLRAKTALIKAKSILETKTNIEKAARNKKEKDDATAAKPKKEEV